MENIKATPKTGYKHVLLTLLPGILYLFTQLAWQLVYFRGHLPGIYWLFYFLDYIFPTSIIISLAAAILLLIIASIQKHRAKFFSFLPTLSLLFLCFTMILSLPTHIGRTAHIQTLRAEGKVFYLSASEFLDAQISIDECDPLGVLCRPIYNSGDITNYDWKTAMLIYREPERILELHQPEKGVLFTYPIP